MSCPDCGRTPRRSRWRLVSLLVAAGVVSALIAWSSHQESSEALGATTRGVIAVEVDERGFSPSSVTVLPGAPLDLEFKRTTTRTCANSVVFPELGVTEELSEERPVRIRVPPDRRERTLSFQCGVNERRGALIIN
jgi:plastocyanin domain-containing protein